MRAKHFLYMVFLGVVLAGCAGGPPVVPGKGAVYGHFSADSHKALVAKVAEAKDPMYGEGGKIVYSKDMVNYSGLTDLFVCLVSDRFSGGREHSIEIQEDGFAMEDLAVAPGDRIRMINRSSLAHSIYLVDVGDGIQTLPSISPGQESVIEVKLTGDLELLSEEKDAWSVRVLSRPGLLGQRVASGESYAFERLEPGSYAVVFWYWRLGSVEKQVNVMAGQNLRIDQVLSVDQVIGSPHESKR